MFFNFLLPAIFEKMDLPGLLCNYFRFLGKLIYRVGALVQEVMGLSLRAIHWMDIFHIILLQKFALFA